VVTILFIGPVTPVASYTTYAPGPGSCKIIGDPDVYGIGVRLCFYLQWAATILASYTDPWQNRIARISSNMITIGVLASNFRSAHHGSLIAVEWYIVLWLTFVLPATNIYVQRSAVSGSLAAQLVLWSIKLLAQPWVYFRAIYAGNKEGCDVFIFLFAKINVNHSGWRTFGKVASVFSVVFAVIFLVITVVILPHLNSNVDEEDDRPTIMQVFGSTIVKLFCGPICIAMVEMTIKINGIDLSSAPLYSSGQLIPFVVGLTTIVITFTSSSAKRRLYSRRRRPTLRAHRWDPARHSTV
jgi:hypothetical protein